MAFAETPGPREFAHHLNPLAEHGQELMVTPFLAPVDSVDQHGQSDTMSVARLLRPEDRRVGRPLCGSLLAVAIGGPQPTRTVNPPRCR
jgi:hypothetical protein